MFKHAKIPWDAQRTASVRIILTKYALGEGVLVVDYSDKKLESSHPNEFIRSINFLNRTVVTLMDKNS
ncbi:MAG: hypothetical protein DRR19_01415 [Candidatus Parabeggiatoa sp. nov. 1]|nr:MAG: hypothetical protein DRR19_01415 [Gammaproteobacteria bacterium]